MKLTKEEIDVFSQEPIELFYQGIRSPITKSKYTEILKRVLCEILEDFLQGTFEQRVKQLVLESKQNPEWSTMILLAIAKKLKERTVLPTTNKNYLNPNSIPNYFKPIRKLFDMNSVPTAWPRIYAAFPETNNNSEGRGYTRLEIQKMLNFAKGALDRAIILVASSSGIREGGLVLQWEDLRPVYRVKDKLFFEITESEIDAATIVCAVITIYRKSNEVNYAFITPEAYNALMDYRLTWFKEIGRQPKDNDPIFKNAGSIPTHLSGAGIKARMYRVAKSSGVWLSPKGGSRRAEIPIMNGFRRFFNKMNKETISKDSSIGALIKKEYMMSHTGLVKLDRNYFQTHIMELVEEYLEAVPNLTISDEERLKSQNQKQYQELSEIKSKQIETEALRKQVRDLGSRLDEMDKQKIESIIDVKSEKFKSLEDKVAELVKNHEHLSAFIAHDPEYYKRLILDEKKRLDEKEKSDNKQS